MALVLALAVAGPAHAESALVAAILRREFSLIILRENLMDPAEGQGDVSPGIAAAIREAYTLDQRNVEFIYKPKP